MESIRSEFEKRTELSRLQPELTKDTNEHNDNRTWCCRWSETPKWRINRLLLSLNGAESQSQHVPNRRYTTFTSGKSSFRNTHWSMLAMLTLAVFLTLFINQSANAFIRGVPASCDNEGQSVMLPLIANDPCITCHCQNREVVCRKESCTSVEGCHMILYDRSDKCCDVCKGCIYNGTEYKTDSVWSDPRNPCQVMTCKAGIVTVTHQQCYTPCKKPQSPEPHQCCPVCKGCMVNGVFHEDGTDVQLDEDRCVNCKCTNGSVICTKQACPVLSCPKNKEILRPKACCPECRGSRKVFELRDFCLVGTKVYRNGQKFQLNDCTVCQCEVSTAVCRRETCPVLLCTTDEYEYEAGVCCPQCRRVNAVLGSTQLQRRVSACFSGGLEYQDGTVWRLNLCTTCECLNGQVRCFVEQCTNNVQCPRGQKPQKQIGECCPVCVEEDAVCTVFGDPHYRTYDGRVFNFQGSCKYLLTADCKAHSFSVRVRNDARTTKSFSWTKTVFIQVEHVKISLEQHLNVRVNRIPVNLPYIKHGIVAIARDGYTVAVRTNLGVRVIWDGESFLEVSVNPSFKNKLCGLCGNYNRDAGDDFVTKKGNLAVMASEFGDSWQVGSVKHCSRPEPSPIREPMCRSKWDVRIKAVRVCNSLKTTMFQACHKKVNPIRYYKSCLLDMCECPSGMRCHCEALTAYTHECQRAGVVIDNWRNITQCEGMSCPKGAIFNPCRNPCVQTCYSYRNPDDPTTPNESECGMRPCVAGCKCPDGMVLHRHRCLKPEKCPSKTKL